MAFELMKLAEEDRREYTLALWPRAGEKITPAGGFIDRENDIRLIYCGNGPYREASNEFQFIFDFKGIPMNINIGAKLEDNDVYFSLLEIKGNDNISTDEIAPYLREAIILFGNQRFGSFGEDISHFIHSKF